jgi:hypothetical protein
MFSLVAMVSKYLLKLWIGGDEREVAFSHQEQELLTKPSQATQGSRPELAGIEQRPMVYRSLEHSDLDYSESKL